MEQPPPNVRQLLNRMPVGSWLLRRSSVRLLHLPGQSLARLVSQPKSTVQDGPAFDDDREITPEYENEVRSYFGLGPIESSGSYGDYEETNGHSGAGTTDSTTGGTVGSGMSMGDTESGEFREHDRNQEGLSQPGSDLEDEDELRV